jgi:hypothetical protein
MISETLTMISGAVGHGRPMITAMLFTKYGLNRST